MDYREIALRLENNEKELQKEIINTINEEDFITIKELYLYLKNNSKKIIVNNYLNILVSNIKDIYDDEMHLNSNLSYLREEQPLIVKFLLVDNYPFSDNQIEHMKNNMLIQLPSSRVVEEISKRIEKKQFSISLLSLSQIKDVLSYAYENKLYNVVEVLIDDYDFIIQYNNSAIKTSKILEYSMNNPFREKIMTSNRFLQELKTTPESITPYLSKEEVLYLKTDIDIKNIFLTKGLRYDVLEASVINNLLDNINVFKAYPFTTINEFSSSVEKPEELLDNEEFLKIYIDKIKDISPNIVLFKLLSKAHIDKIIAQNPKEVIYLNLFINAKDKYHEWLLEKDVIKNTLYNTNQYVVYNYLDDKLLLDILKTKDSYIKYYEYFSLLNDKEKKELLDNKKFYNEFINEIEKNKMSVEDINSILSVLDLSYQKEFVKDITDFFPSYLYVDFFSKNIPIFLEVIRSNKNLYRIINSFIPTEETKIKYLLKNLSRDDLLKIKQEEISNPKLATIIREFAAYTDKDSTDFYLNTPTDILLKNLRRNDSLVIKLIKEKYSNDFKRNIILSSDEMLNIFLDKEYIELYDLPLLLSILDRLNKEQKERYITKDLLDYLYSKDIIKVLNNLKEKNRDIYNTLNISFLNEDTIKLRFNILEYITKYKELQDYTLVLLNYITAKDITNLFLSLKDYDKEYLLPKLLKLITESLKGKNRKKVGNFVRFFKEIKIINEEDWLNIISYLLYHIPLVPEAIKNNIVDVPTSYSDIKNYEIDFNKLASDPLLNNYKLTREEIYYLTNKYSKGYLFINTINHLNLKNKAKGIKRNYKILEVYKELTNIKEDYNNKLSYELKKTTNNLKKINNKLVKENFTFYASKDKYTYLILDNNQLKFDKYMKYINDVSTSFRTILLKEDNISPQNGIYYTYSNFNSNSLKDFDEDGYYLNKYSNSKNSNSLTLPDNILVIEDNTEDLSFIVDAIKLYKSFKPYKELKIILLNKEDIYNRLVDNYKRNTTISNLSKCVKMLSENGYKYPITSLSKVLYKHLKTKDKAQVNRILLEYNIKDNYVDKFD